MRTMGERSVCITGWGGSGRKTIGLARLVLLGATLTVAISTAAAASDGQTLACCFSATERAVRAGYGASTRGSLDFYTLGARVAFDLPHFVPSVAGNRVRLAVDLLGSVIKKGSSRTGEVAFSPLLLDYRYDRGQRVVPFVEGGEGLVYTWVRDQRLGGAFQFSSQAGAGIHLFVTHTQAVTIGFRFRHISNAGLRSENSGLNTQFLFVGWSSFPGRE